MTLELYRDPSVDGRTMGRLSIDGRFFCWTLEDVVRDGPKLAHETAVPAGRYQVAITKSTRFGRMMPLLLDVPGFSGIRIHSGNTSADTAGCILVGFAKVPGGLGASRTALEELQARIARALAGGDAVVIDILNAARRPEILNA